MSIRTRLTLLFAAIAALAVLLAAVVGYRSAADRVRTELDVSLRDGAARATFGPGRGCFRDAPPIGDQIQRRGFAAAGTKVQCVAADGHVSVVTNREDDEATFPVDSVDVELSKSRADETIPPGPPQSTGGVRRRRERGAPGGIESASREVRIRTIEEGGERYRVASAAIPGGGLFMIGRDLRESRRVLDGLRGRFSAIGGLVVLLSALIGAMVAGALTKPLRALTGVTESIAENGGLAESAEIDASVVKRPDELGRLAKSFSSMLATLRGTRAQQRQLAQDAGHELRTPLTSLRTNVDVLTKYPDLDPAKRALILTEMDAELRELSSLTDELLVLATDSTPDDPIVSLDLGELTRRAIDRLERRTARKVRAQITQWSMEGRRIQLSRAIDNVLANAAKFDSSDQPIEVTVAHGVIKVRDHGPGFVASDLPHVFDRFYRSDTARQLPGTGLGLAIVADAARSHGGTVVASNHVDGGAVIELSLR